jgi:hypothetical protein
MRLPLALVTVALFITACSGDDNRVSDHSPTDRTGKPDSWRVIAESPIKSDYGHESVWTGKEVIIWGCSRLRGDSLRSHYVRTGGAYNRKTALWRKVPAAPIPGGSGYSAIWTGNEMILWGDPGGGPRSAGNLGAAYDPATNEWRRIASGPLTGRAGHLAVWTGDEMIVWGGYLTAYERERYDGAGAPMTRKPTRGASCRAVRFPPDTTRWAHGPEKRFS